MPLSATGPQNRFMSGDPQGGPPDRPQPAQGLMPQQGAPMGAPQGVPAQAPASPPSPEAVEVARTHLQEIYNALKPLTEQPTLKKQDVFKAASEMIANGAFPTMGSKQQLISEMANLPDDERGLRRAIGSHLMQVSANLMKLNAVHGPAPMGGLNAS